MDWQIKISILRRYETYCYQICYYLIQNESNASQAAKEALLSIAVDAFFFTDSDETRREKIRRISIDKSLLWQGNGLRNNTVV
ncbi:hypothetical protein M3194_05430 [Paenibacillus glycanilyticus]|uniref:hypothetical protein n=1 Tax=Paenibacillus glycanilyticus TaxID=126569 RepID=UPI00203C326F|nr:hypothetical protein [Paenibacillus glycanilyticus]MCM3626800.1 hypothetical protein [Paenibacillus glycanilyticus]